MKAEIMASLLVKGDIVIVERKKYLIINTLNAGSNTKLLYKPLNKKGITSIKQIPSNQFLTVINNDRFF